MRAVCPFRSSWGSMEVWSHDRWGIPLPPGHRFPISKYRLLRERVAGLVDVREADPVPGGARGRGGGGSGAVGVAGARARPCLAGADPPRDAVGARAARAGPAVVGGA